VNHPTADSSKRRLRDFLATPVFLVCMLMILVVFHVLQIVARRVSVRWQEHMYDYLCLFLLLDLKHVARARFDVQVPETLPTHAPLIFVSNHQSMFDIPLEGWYLRAYRPRFVAKRELRHGVPAVSYALRTLGHALIDRNDRRQSITAIKEFARELMVTGRSAAIFPEGTRSRDGIMQPLKGAGVLAILRELPQATIVPMAVDGSWQIERHRLLPIPVGMRLTLHVLPALDAAQVPRPQLTDHIDGLIRMELDRIRGGGGPNA
jgi:1-acyl-sn-glycerol-3-phosphate acyltransferase